MDTRTQSIEETTEYIGMWVTADGYIRHELLPGNRYDEARGKRKSAYRGSYRITGNHIDYRDDTGFTADGEFRNGILYHAGMVLYKEEKTIGQKPMNITIKSILTGLLFAAVLQLSAQTASETRNAQAIRKLYEAVNAKDLQYIKSLGDAKSEWLDVPFHFTSKGENAIIGPWQSWFEIFPDARCEVKSLVSFGDYVVAQGIGTGTQKGVFNSPAGVLQPTGVSMHVNFCDVYLLKDGKILRADSYFDFYGLWKQLTSK